MEERSKTITCTAEKEVCGAVVLSEDRGIASAKESHGELDRFVQIMALMTMRDADWWHATIARHPGASLVQHYGAWSFADGFAVGPSGCKHTLKSGFSCLAGLSHEPMEYLFAEMAQRGLVVPGWAVEGQRLFVNARSVPRYGSTYTAWASESYFPAFETTGVQLAVRNGEAVKAETLLRQAVDRSAGKLRLFRAMPCWVLQADDARRLEPLDKLPDEAPEVERLGFALRINSKGEAFLGVLPMGATYFRPTQSELEAEERVRIAKEEEKRAKEEADRLRVESRRREDEETRRALEAQDRESAARREEQERKQAERHAIVTAANDLINALIIAYEDGEHRRFDREHSFDELDAAWREADDTKAMMKILGAVLPLKHRRVDRRDQRARDQIRELLPTFPLQDLMKKRPALVREFDQIMKSQPIENRKPFYLFRK